MTHSQNVTVNASNSIAGLLGIAFIVLKLVGVIGWPWVWVLAPFWIPIAVTVLVVLIFLAAYVLERK